MNPLCWLDSHRGRYTVVRWLFPRLLAGIYLIAVISWGVQYDGLVGENGIVPAKTLLENVHAFENGKYPDRLANRRGDLHVLEAFEDREQGHAGGRNHLQA